MEDWIKFLLLEAILIVQGIVIIIYPKWYQIALLPLGILIGYFIKAGIKTEED